MRKCAAAALAAALLAGGGGMAFAASTPYEGTVRSVGPQNETVTFEDGTKFQVGKGVEVDGLDPGTEVIFYYHTYDGQKTVVSYAYPGSADLAIQPAAGQ